MAIYMMVVDAAPKDIKDICENIAIATGVKINVNVKLTATITTEDPMARFELGKLFDPEPISIEEAVDRL